MKGKESNPERNEGERGDRARASSSLSLGSWDEESLAVRGFQFLVDQPGFSAREPDLV